MLQGRGESRDTERPLRTLLRAEERQLQACYESPWQSQQDCSVPRPRPIDGRCRPPAARSVASSSAGNGFSTNGNANNDPLDSCERLGEATHEKGSVRDSLRKVSIGDRIGCYTWTWFTSTMATGGIANVIYTLPYAKAQLKYLGIFFFLLNLLLFIMNCICITIRFRRNPGSFTASFTDQFESLFIQSFIVSCGVIFINICQYGIPATGAWMSEAMEAVYWFYLAISFASSAGVYLVLWSTQIFPIQTMTPVWVFPAYPLLLAAPFATNLIGAAERAGFHSNINTLAVAMAAVAMQGTGYLISFMVSASFLYRLMTQKLPRDPRRPGVFISVGPPAFTAAGLIGLGNQAETIVPPNFMRAGPNDGAAYILRLLAIMVGLWLWLLCLWFFVVSVGSLWKYVKPDRSLPYQITWFSFVFPNTALVTATEQIAMSFDNEPLKIIGVVLAGILVIVWIGVVVCTVRAIWMRQLLWPADVEETK